MQLFWFHTRRTLFTHAEWSEFAALWISAVTLLSLNINGQRQSFLFHSIWTKPFSIHKVPNSEPAVEIFWQRVEYSINTNRRAQESGPPLFLFCFFSPLFSSLLNLKLPPGQLHRSAPRLVPQKRRRRLLAKWAGTVPPDTVNSTCSSPPVVDWCVVLYTS